MKETKVTQKKKMRRAVAVKYYHINIGERE